MARAPATKDQGTVRVGELPAIKIVGGNAGEWAAKKELRTLEVTSKKGRQSAGLERLSKGKSKIPSLKVTTPIGDPPDDHLPQERYLSQAQRTASRAAVPLGVEGVSRL